ncbi:MAG: hypothetical protein HBSAPP02_30120 [Phycisphaerae bacterium]|nr:MAG: flagellar protein FlgN [Planctomycetia bacterium]RIK69450.1 MAG: hypothetical protein DCC66_08775 [Planctomycetota bacterium]GJQ27980.1 MAG: hypothetical protein HBSAPP02_30120 [Phycisphaerae bacterium]
MTASAKNKLAPMTQGVEALARLLDQLIARHEALHTVIADKLESMRRSDVPAMLEASAREAAMTDEILKLDQQRAAVATDLATRMQWPANVTVRIRALAARLEPAAAKKLIDRADVLREKMLAVARANRVVELVCKQMLQHMKAVFADLVHPDDSNRTYSAGGGVERPAGPQVFNTVV